MKHNTSKHANTICKVSLILQKNNKILDVIKLKAFADDKINVTHMMISVHQQAENIMGKEENAGYQHFLLFP